MEEELRRLLLQEEEWEIKEINQDEWQEMMYWEQGLSIYENLTIVDPENEQYRLLLA